ncbi:GspH/FimT family pseudopilin [Sphingopyxis sp. XHP0097]|uniref:Type II secretion system protein H n=1 Tax=Sphingopyxis jiangsuensis TaxID=2871171 RepID=A0ABS7MH03_9SPHN|nr:MULTISPECIES: GspH/FimT family pseudopilin [Sphingopyxis]MBY4637969.1 GspH/FimT family pseudopilin [Sphingopyxis jiangsuensis]
MPIFAETAERDGGRRRSRTGGFTLVELMVVLMILALAATAVVLTIPDEQQTVRSEADRLAARLAAARDIAVVEGRSVAVRFAPSGYGFERRIEGSWQPLPGRSFAQRNWPSDVAFAGGDGQPVARLIFDRVGTSPTPQALVLSGGGARETVRISATGEVSRGR